MNSKGFTLIELMIVVAIILILASVFFPSLGENTSVNVQTRSSQGIWGGASEPTTIIPE